MAHTYHVSPVLRVCCWFNWTPLMSEHLGLAGEEEEVGGDKCYGLQMERGGGTQNKEDVGGV